MKIKTKKSDTSLAITTLPPSPDEERHGRMIRYSLAMLIRLICVILAFVIPFGWWTLLPAIGAVVLPYVAVVLANVGQEGARRTVERPGAVEVYRPENVYHPEDFQGETYRTEPSRPDPSRTGPTGPETDR
ncbi:hypothetical protein GCM10025867_28300 [Frondihabitans sucicola]|uniref:DUF3099 domain-containing protein n=1 Tax=Frondihabitans sucicola TaxID=1268041 RepID=A0ABM8GQ87_9MICO|nr:DUF3099 domain-containing protein [Frondihabitans sucicola]BDZ50589.1 hypothetical protein GCM10025867_28300 [Frondihabitans sucicola]